MSRPLWSESRRRFGSSSPPSHAGPRAPRRRARYGKDGARAGPRRQHRAASGAHPVHARSQPTDVTGLSIWSPPGANTSPVAHLANIVLVDEINRALPKAQSALLEGMAEFRVTVDGVMPPASRSVPADRNREPDRAGGRACRCPRRSSTVFCCAPRSAIRRFDEEILILERAAQGPSPRAPAAGGRRRRGQHAAHRQGIEQVYVDPLLRRWGVELVRATRTLEFVELGAPAGSVRISRSSARLAAGRSCTVAHSSYNSSARGSSVHRQPSADALGGGSPRRGASRRPTSGAAGLGRLLARAPRSEPDWDDPVPRRVAVSERRRAAVPALSAPRRRFSGVQSGERRSPGTRRRRRGRELRGPCQQGDRISTIDWAASRLGSRRRGAPTS